MMGSVERKAAARATPAVSGIPITAGPQGRVAHRLRDVRRKQGLSLDDVAEALKIRKTYIRAIEGERYAELPGPAYALGFVGSYAQFLDLDRKAIIARFREEFAGVDTETELKFLVPLKEGRFPGRLVLAASIVLAIAVYGGWYAYTNSGAGTPVANTAPPASQPAKAKPVSAKPAEAKPAEAKSAEAKPTVAKAKAAAAKADLTGLLRSLRAVAAVEPDAVVLDRRKSRPKPDKATRAAARRAKARKATQSAKARKAKAMKSAAAAAPASGKARIILKALEDTWVRIRLADGTMVLSRLLKAGDSYAVLENRGMVLTAGNAGGLRIIVDGRTLPALGPKGAIRKGIRLDADELLASR
jgi:cytoskeleton protein RodZ